ncbi:hypothetical protein Hanom_Chr10g00958831 [Helianthus anomalus]
MGLGKMAPDTKFTIKFILLSLIFLEIYVSPTNQTQNAPSISNLPLTTLQDEAAPMIIKKDNIQVARMEAQLAKARGEIRKSIVQRSLVSNGSLGTMYRNPFSFFQLSA